MLQLMRGAEGIGLAGPQIGLSWRIFVCDIPRDPEQDPLPPDSTPLPPDHTDGPQIWLNPRIVECDRQVVPYEEGCLSLPGIRGDVNRPATVTMEAQTPEGETRRVCATGLLARCWQHEIDHLNGILFVDRLSPVAKVSMKNRLKRLVEQG
jgi:peptide deformylase